MQRIRCITMQYSCHKSCYSKWHDGISLSQSSRIFLGLVHIRDQYHFNKNKIDSIKEEEKIKLWEKFKDSGLVEKCQCQRQNRPPRQRPFQELQRLLQKNEPALAPV